MMKTVRINQNGLPAKGGRATFKIFIFGLSLFVLTFAWHSSMYAQEATKEEEAFFVAKKAYADGFYDVSLELLERFLKNYASSAKLPEANLLIGQCYFHQGKFLNALSTLEPLDHAEVAAGIQDALWYWIGEVHCKGNNFNKAAEYYKRIVDTFPGSAFAASAYYSLGWCLFQESNFIDASKYFKDVEDLFPRDPLVYDSSFKLLECLYNLKEYAPLKEKAKQYLKTFEKDAVKTTYLRFYLAEADYYLGNFADAAQEYSGVASISKDEKVSALSRLGAGWAYVKLKRYHEAQEEFNQIGVDTLEKNSKDTLLLGKGLLALETRDFSQARVLYSQLIHSSDPLVVIQGYLGMADALYNLAEYAQAISIYKKTLETLPESSSRETLDKLHYGLAWAYLKQGMFKDAIGEFQNIAQSSEDKVVKVAALCQIGDTYQDSGEYEKAIKSYDTILKNFPDSLYGEYIQYQLGLTLLKSSQYDAAIAACAKLKSTFPHSVLLDDATYALGLAYFQREDYNASRDVFQEFSKEHGQSPLMPQATYLLATSFYNLGKYKEAIEVFKGIIREYGQDVELCQKAEYEIADCFYQLGDENEAMARFKALRTKYPDSKLTAEVIWWLGEYYYRHRDFILARRYFSALIQDFPKNNLIPDAYYALGSISEEEENFQEALEYFQKVRELGKADLAATASIAIADLYVRQEQFDVALAAFKEAAQLHPHLAALIYPKIADVYRRTNDYGPSIDFYRKSLEVVPVTQMAAIQFKIAEVFELQEKIQPAIEEYLKVSYLYPESKVLVVKSLLRVAAIYEERGNTKEALVIYKKIAGMDAQEAKFAFERIEALGAGARK